MKKLTKNFSLNKLSVLLLLLFPAGLVAGPLIAEILMNLINVVFLYKIFKSKNYKFFNNKFFKIFILFYFYLLISIFFSDYLDKILIKHIFYIRHLIFIFAIVDLLNSNKNLVFTFYKILSITLFVVSLSGLLEFYFNINLFVEEKLRPDRLSGLFGDKLIIGGYLSRLLPLLLGLFFYNLKDLKFNNIIYGCITLIVTFLTIMLSGERMAFFTSVTFILVILILVGVSKKIKLAFFSLIIIILTSIFLVNPVVLDRHYKQTIDQVDFEFQSENFFSNFSYYKNIYETSYNAFVQKKILGQGVKSFRYFCSDPELEAYTRHLKREKLVDQNFTLFDNDFKDKEISVIEVNLGNKKFIKKGEIVFKYVFNNKTFEAYSNEDIFLDEISHIKEIPNDLDNTKYLDKITFNEEINTNSILISYFQKKNGCTTHPHNFFLQLLSETGMIGFSFVFIIFIYLLVLITKYTLLIFFKNKQIYSNFQICLLISFFITLLPFIPNGNFFNNWMNMIMFLPIGFYIYSLKKN
jgi:O-antigen ligase